MLKPDEAFIIAKERFEEANVLLKNTKYDGALYLSGYAVELMLKRHIMLKLDWDEYPERDDQFKSFKTHRLDVLLKLSGLEKTVKADSLLYAKWQIVAAWDSEIRYKAIGGYTQVEAQDIIDKTREILNYIHEKI